MDTRQALARFIGAPLDDLLALPSGAEGDAAVERAMLDHFREVVATVPAYRAFLVEHGVDPASVKSLADFRKLPLATREGYIKKHPLAARARNGTLTGLDMVAVSSGSSGEPTFWPRSAADEIAIAERFEQVFRDAFAAHEKKTLAVVCFALGTWVGGMFTAACCRHLAAKGYPILVVTPGNVVPEILRVVNGLAPSFEQTVLLGYPPFLKDAIDHGTRAGIDWKAHAIKLVTAGEVFSEEWRSLVCARAGIADPCRGVASLYGTADAGVLANETPLSVSIRRFVATKPELARELFGEDRLPTLAQYDPRARFFEVHEGTLLFSGSNGVPLVRYHIADTGGLIAHEEMLDRVKRAGFDARTAMGDAPLRNLPFVYVFGRTLFAVSFFGANVFPETVAMGLEAPSVAPHVTGKFVLESKEGLGDAPHLALAIELAPGSTPPADFADTVAVGVKSTLLRVNSELRAYAPPQFQTPRVTLHPAGDPDWFPVGVKHRYTRR